MPRWNASGNWGFEIRMWLKTSTRKAHGRWPGPDRRQVACLDFQRVGDNLTHLPNDGVKKAHLRADSCALFLWNQVHHGGFQNFGSVIVILGSINDRPRPRSIFWHNPLARR